MAYQKAPEAAFAIHAGDLINTAHKDLEWAEWFKAGGWIHAQWTGVPVLGNHEFSPIAKDGKRTVSLHWRPQFTLPVEAGLPDDLSETVYSFDYQQVRVVVLNSIMNPEAQTAYLEEKLKQPGAKWKILTCHYSIFSPAKGRDFAYARKAWKPLLDKYGVDLVLQGHDHTYARGQVPVKTVNGGYLDRFQTLYVTSVSGTKMYEVSSSQLKSYASQGYRPIKTAEQKQFFQVINIEGDKLTYTAYTADGEVYDQAVITKDFETGKKTLE
jgi:3',5'-cyclic AMP phosphodiesterase CpdA